LKPKAEPLPYNWRITKYNPALRDSAGAYQVDEWTSFADIGSEFMGDILTHDNYRQWEDTYVASALALLRETGLNSLTVRELETRGKGIPVVFDDIPTLSAPPVDGAALTPEVLDTTMRMCLRESLWCKLEAAGRFYIHFGWDYYMYIGSDNPCPNAIQQTSSVGLFVDDFASPYLSE